MAIVLTLTSGPLGASSVVPRLAGTPSAPAPTSGTSSGPGAAPGTGPAAKWTLGASFAWSRLSSTAPLGESGGGFAVLGGTGVLFGGRTALGVVGGTWLYNETLDRWSALRPTAPPTARSGFGFAADPAHDRALLFGGLLNLTTDRVAADTWSFSFATENWTNLTGTTRPGAREAPAFAVGNGVALLYGGVDPNVTGTGELIYSDTWLLNLSTGTWRQISVASSPGPLLGAGLVWDPARSEFLLFGGCYPCVSSVWAFTPSNSTWSLVAPSGPMPAPRRDASWTWEAGRQLAILFGGANGTTTFNDTFFFDPASGLWTELASSVGPAPRSSAASDLFAVPGNETLFLTGGGTAGAAFSDAWRLATVANVTLTVTNASSGGPVANATVRVGGLALETNASGGAWVGGLPSTETSLSASAPGFASLSRSAWLSPGANSTFLLRLTPLPPATVDVRVLTSSGIPVALAWVNVSYGVHPLPGPPHRTSAFGFVNLTGVPAGNGTLTATLADFHTNRTSVYFPPAATIAELLILNPFLELDVHAVGKLPDGNLTALGTVTVTVDRGRVGSTNAAGWVNVSTVAFGRTELEGTVYGFHPGFQNITATYTGAEVVDLTLVAEPFPSISVEALGILGGGSELLVANARVNLTNTTPLATGELRESLSTGADGRVIASVPAGNYSARVSARGFAENDSVPPVWAPPSVGVVLTVLLPVLPLAVLDVEVVSSTGDHPALVGASVSLDFTAVNLSDGVVSSRHALESSRDGGWANFSGLAASLLYLNVSYPGYSTNETLLGIAYGQVLAPYRVELTPLPPSRSVDLVPVSLDLTTILALFLVPAAALVGALVYLTMLRNPSARTDAPPGKDGAGSSEPNDGTGSSEKDRETGTSRS